MFARDVKDGESVSMFDFISPFLVYAAVQMSNYDRIVESLKKLATENPQVAQLIDIGISDSGKPIYGLKIGNGATPTLVVATHHGNEYGSTAVGIGMAESLVKEPIADQTVYVIPVLNISGYDSRSRYEKASDSRYYDPNRDYPGPCGTDGPFKLKSTKALAQFVDEKNIVTSATLHTYMPGVLYPWGFSTRETRTEDESTYIDLSRVATQESHYQYGNSTDILYAADGTYDDYSYWKHGIWSLLFEMGGTHSPNQNQINEMVRVNVPGIRNFLATAPKERSQQHTFTGQCDTKVRRRTVLE